MAAKIIKFSKKVEPTGCLIERIPLAICREILNADGNNFSDEEVIIARDFLYQMAELNHLCFINYKQAITETKIKEIDKYLNNETQSNIISSSEYGRAS
jgi:hypothetical protein